MKLRQISLSIENSPDRLYRVTKALGEAGINLRAMNLVDAGGLGLLRILVSNVAAARRVMMEHHLPAYVEEVVAVEIEDRPGSLSELLKLLMEGQIRVVYTYAFVGMSEGNAVMIFRFNDNDKAIELLKKKGIQLMDSKSFGILESE